MEISRDTGIYLWSRLKKELVKFWKSSTSVQIYDFYRAACNADAVL